MAKNVKTAPKSDAKSLVAAAANAGVKGVSAAPTAPVVAPTASASTVVSAVVERKSIPLTATITVVATANPKRPGTKAATKWPLYSGCKTVADVVTAFVAKGYPKRRAFSAIRWDSERGFVKLG